jgi:hypothetical protein
MNSYCLNFDEEQLQDCISKAITSRIKYYINPEVTDLDPRFVTNDLLMLMEIGITPENPFIKFTIKELCSYQEENGSWFDSIWETAEAIRILQVYVKNTVDEGTLTSLNSGISWLLQQRKKDGTWLEEIWETLFAVKVILFCKDHENPLVKDIEIDNSIGWLINQINNKHLVNYHFTGLFLLLLCDYKGQLSLPKTIIDNSIQELSFWLLSNRNSDGVWSREIYANCYACMGLMAYNSEFAGLEKVIQWLIDKQNKRTGEWDYDRREASSLATIILFRYYIKLLIRNLTHTSSNKKLKLNEIAAIIQKANDTNLHLNIHGKSVGEYCYLPKILMYLLYFELIVFITGFVVIIAWELI